MAIEKASKNSAKVTAQKGSAKLGPTPATHSSAYSGVDVQLAIADPLSASPAALLSLQRTQGNHFVQRLLEGAMQRKSSVGLEGGAIESALQTQIERAQGGGQPLDRSAGSQIGGALGADFSGVRVHTDGQSDTLNRSLSAKAFTLGSDIFFSRGAYDPGSSSGKQLLAHELTHVVQQGGSQARNVQTKLTVGPAGDKYEQEADRIAKSLNSSGGLRTAYLRPSAIQRRARVVQRVEGEEQEQEQETGELPLFMQALKWGFHDDPKKMYEYLAPKDGDVGGGKLGSFRRGAQRFGAGAAALGSGAVTGALSVAGVGAGAALGAAALPVAATGGALGLAGRGMEKLTNYATGDTDTPASFEGKSKWDQFKTGAKYVGKGLLSPLSLLGLGIGAAGRGVERLGNYVGGKQDTSVNWAGKSTGEKAKQALKYVGLGLISPLLLPFLGIGAIGRAAGLPETISKAKKSAWDPAATHQKESLVAGGGAAGGGIVGGGVGGAAGFISSLAQGSDYTAMPEQLRQADLALKNRPVSEGMVSQTGQGFGAAGGIIGGLSGLVTTGTGVRALAQEKGVKKLTRGAGRIVTGLGQTFAGITTAGKSIATLMGSATSAAQFMATAALPAQVAMSGIDIIKGGYMGIKAFSRHKELSKVAALPEIQADPQKVAFVEFAKEYMKKRGRNAGLSVLAGALGVTGGALMLSGFGAVVGAPLLIASAAVKLGTMFGPMIRDKILDKWRGKGPDGKTYSERKKEKESQMAQYAADNWGKKDVQAILTAMGMEQKTINSLQNKKPEEIKAIMLALIMRR